MREPLQRDRLLRSLVSYAIEAPLTMMRLRAFLRERRVSVINCHYPMTATLTFALMRALRLCSARLVLTFHGSDAQDAAASRGSFRWAWRAVLRWSDAVSTVSSSLLQELIASFPEVAHKTSVIRNGISAERLGEEQQEWARSGGTPAEVGGRCILSVGSYVPVKGQEVLLRAFARASARIGPARLVIAGRRGPSLAGLQALVEELGLSGRVTLLVDEPHARVMDLYHRAEMFVLPSLREGFPLVLLEAGCMGLPVLASRVGGIAELIESERDGLLVEPEDPVALAEAIESLWSDPVRARRLGSALRQKVMEKYTWERTARAYMRIMRIGGEAEAAAPGDPREGTDHLVK
jgi:glycosyltransferase involved in cell wall biosynthesis